MPKVPKLRIIQPTTYGVYDDGPLVKFQIGNSVQPMTWDVALRAAAKIRVHLRDAREFIGQERFLGNPNREVEPDRVRVDTTVAREHPILIEGQYRIYADGPEVIWKIRDERLGMAPDDGRNISSWLFVSGTKVQAEYFPDMTLRVFVAHLTDGVAAERMAQARRDSTARFS